MSNLHLVVGNKNYSSWSMRGWLAVRRTGAPFEETVIPLHQPDSASLKATHCPAGKVPVLRDGAVTIWDSLAICEHLAERFPEARMWPVDPAARSVARSVCSEMHSGFGALRTHMPMNCRAAYPGKGRAEGVDTDIRRILSIFSECRSGFGDGGEFLFGDYSIADIFFAPVISRFQTYAIELDEVGRAYSEAMFAHPDIAAWHESARQEPWTIEQYDSE